MTHRRFKDGSGTAWEVWEVYPSAVEQRISGEHPTISGADGPSNGRREIRIRVPSALQAGWLAFQAGTERRRLAPIPQDWLALDDEALLRLLAAADRLNDGDGA